MNKRDWIVLAVLVNGGYESHRSLTQRSGYSIGFVHAALKKLQEEEFIDEHYAITDKVERYMDAIKPQRAVILAAGMGLRMTPINHVPKGLLKVGGEPLIERIINQLHEVGIRDISVVVGYMMERFDYLVDTYGVELIYNDEFAAKDTLHSLWLASDRLENAYIVPAGIWFARNPFNIHEFFAWYAVGEYIDEESYIRVNRNMELMYTKDKSGGNSMIGLGYISKNEAPKVQQQLEELNSQRKHAHKRWERALFDGDKFIGYARVMRGQVAYEIHTYEHLRDLDSESRDLKSKRLNLVSEVFEVETEEITDISALLISMTNRLMQFSIKGNRYLLREPGEGSNELTNRKQEAEVYHALEGKNLTDTVVYISPEDGYKIAEYLEDSRRCNSEDAEDIAACIRHLRKLHNMRLEVSHTFDVMEKLHEYEKLRGDESSFSDYEAVRSDITAMMAVLDSLPKELCLCHIDSVSDNFLFVDDQVYLIDWEYAGMSEPDIDIAMFCLYADYDKEKIDSVIDIYYPEGVSDISRFKIYAYIASAGLLWSVWCDYKKKFGVEFGSYSMKQYRYAKRFYRHSMALAEQLGLVEGSEV